MIPPRASLLGFLLLAATTAPLGAVTMTTANVAVTEDFDTLATTTGSLLPAGWDFLETGTGANTTYGAGTGSSSTGNTYSFGAASASDRAFGTLRTSSLAATIGTIVTNQTGATVTQLAIQYVGEQWRLGATGRADRLDFAYSLDATSLANGTWIDVDALDFTGPTTAGATGALDGNAVENRVALSYTLTGLSLANGASLWLRWSDFDATGSDDGLAIDNVALTAAIAAPPDPQNVPERMPLGMIAAVLAALLAWAGRAHRAVTLRSGGHA